MRPTRTILWIDMIEDEKLLDKVALALQQDCQQTVENIMVATGIPSDKKEVEEKIRQGQHCWTLKKLAEHEIRLQRIESFLVM